MRGLGGIKGLKCLTGFIQVLCEGLDAMKVFEYLLLFVGSIKHVRQAYG